MVTQVSSVSFWGAGVKDDEDGSAALTGDQLECWRFRWRFLERDQGG